MEATFFIFSLTSIADKFSAFSDSADSEFTGSDLSFFFFFFELLLSPPCTFLSFLSCSPFWFSTFS
ncbi:hypothetical protein HanIR_Chr09g0393861 [Helianthus annuus]|nr:hypothetical protein HanIR_Chr09g0393861 [Helianthus annuus]